MDFDQLNTFVEVAKLGSFSRAAEKVLRSQPAVSAQIRQLEQEYGHRLFDRTAKSVRLTPAGEVILEYARQLLALRGNSLRAVAERNGVPVGTLSIGANEGTFLYVLPKVFAKYHKMFPKIRISVYRNFTHKVIEKVEDGALDLGIVTLPVKSPSLTVVPLFNKRSVTMEELAQQPLIIPKTGSTRKLIEKNLRPYRENLNITMELTSLTMIKRFVAAGFGVSLISSTFARENVRRGDVKLLKIEGLEISRELGLIFQKHRSLPRVASMFAELARKELAPPKVVAEA